MLSQRASILKKKGGNANGQFQNMHLAVFPYEIQFLKDIDNKTAFYFQKKYQVIGKINQNIPPLSKGQKYELKSLENIIHFRLFSQNNVVYQWSAYRIHENGQEQYVDSCAINLKEIVANFIIPQKSLGSRSVESLINLSFGNHELKLKFSKLGFILSINLLISDDPKSFREVIEKKYCPENQQNIHLGNFLKTDSASGVIPLSSRKNKSSQEQKELSSSIKLLKNQSRRVVEQTKSQNQQEQDLMDLDNLILSGQKIRINLHTAQNDNEQLNFKNKDHDQLKKKQQQKKQAISIEQQPLRSFPSKQVEIQNDISSGILKLLSDQVQKDKVDIKLELQQLQMIEEQIRSSKQTINDTISPRFQSKRSTDRNLPTTPNKAKIPFKPIKQEQNQQNSIVTQPKFTLKKGIIYFIIFFLISITGATIMKGINQKKGKSKRK